MVVKELICLPIISCNNGVCDEQWVQELIYNYMSEMLSCSEAWHIYGIHFMNYTCIWQLYFSICCIMYVDNQRVGFLVSSSFPHSWTNKETAGMRKRGGRNKETAGMRKRGGSNKETAFLAALYYKPVHDHYFFRLSGTSLIHSKLAITFALFPVLSLRYAHAQLRSL